VQISNLFNLTLNLVSCKSKIHGKKFYYILTTVQMVRQGDQGPSKIQLNVHSAGQA